jgi:hypothetical protein
MALAGPAAAHALDEYLQAAIISLEPDRVQVSMRLTPGVAVLPEVLASIDTDSDQVISETERQQYAERVLSDVSLKVDDTQVPLRLISVNFPSMDQMKDGLGAIQIELTANAPAGNSSRKLVFENHHQSGISAYLVNSLVPRDPGMRITAQDRTADQSVYQLGYVLGNPGGVTSMFRLGMRHIAAGIDHQHALWVCAGLFLLALACSTLAAFRRERGT